MIIVITGPTGVGKTKLSISLAKRYNTEIINGDSVQVYRGMDIGSAKVTEVEKENMPHHLFDIREVWQDYSVYDYQKDCRKLIDEITKKKKNVIIVGGTGLYIKSALYDYTLDNKDNDKEEEQYEDMTTEEIYQELMRLDKDIEIDRYNRRRVVRALNYYKQHGHSISLNKNGNKLLYDAIFVGLTMDNREELYQRINERVDVMISKGLLEEVKSFHDRNIYDRPLKSAIGYKELYQYFDNNVSYEEAVQLIKRNSRRYAKRQYTFFNHQFDIKWFNVNLSNFDETINNVCEFIDNRNK